MDDDGYAHLRFGDGQLGRAPEAGEVFAAMYRVGIGPLGNVGAEAINQIVATACEPLAATLTPRNPLPAAGGTDPESIANVRLTAPRAFQGELMRAVSADDYARLAERNPRVQRAAAELRWTGIRYQAHVAIDPLGSELPDPLLLRRIEADLQRYRRIGHEVTVVPPNYVPLDIAIMARVLPGYVRSEVEAAMLDNFSNRTLPGGRRGIFHPDNLSFGDSIHVSKLIAAAQSIAGVESVAVTRLQRRFAGPEQEIENGVLPIGPLEVARLDNDPLFPENGRLALTLRGGQ
jgi:predicted phage baseplate assembly protein